MGQVNPFSCNNSFRNIVTKLKRLWHLVPKKIRYQSSVHLIWCFWLGCSMILFVVSNTYPFLFTNPNLLFVQCEKGFIYLHVSGIINFSTLGWNMIMEEKINQNSWMKLKQDYGVVGISCVKLILCGSWLLGLLYNNNLRLCNYKYS